MSQQLVKPSNTIEPTDLVLNWEIYECPECGGHGEISDDYDGSIAFCENCNGTGELAICESKE